MTSGTVERRSSPPTLRVQSPVISPEQPPHTVGGSRWAGKEEDFSMGRPLNIQEHVTLSLL
jgi:hypothetical protein